MLSTMQDRPLLITGIFSHGRDMFRASEVATFEGETSRHATFAEVAGRVDRLAGALTGLGIGAGDRVATFCWNTQEHLEAYFAIPCMGAVLHTLNIRLFPEQLVYVVNHAQDLVVIVDDSLIPLLARVAHQLPSVRHYVVTGDGDVSALAEAIGGSERIMRYEELIAATAPGFEWPDLDERSAAAMCYTSGTTGNPKGVVYSHRSSFLHSLAATSGAVVGLTEYDRVLPVVPMFHANAWGLAYASWMVGADLVMPGRFLQAAPLARLIATERPTVAGAVPTIWNDLLHYGESHELDLASLRMVPCGGSAVPLSLMQAFQERYGVKIVQAWGMTETSPIGTFAHLPRQEAGGPDEWKWRSMTGRVIPGVELRLVGSEGSVLPWDGTSVGEIEVRGPWVTASYYLEDDPAKFHDGWLRTGDVGFVDPNGFVQLTDRVKDVIKSGGEWISSVELENAIMAHPEVVEAAVIGVSDEKWGERPLACVARRRGSHVDAAGLKAFLEGSVARWQVPEYWTFVDAVPRTSVGKFDKKVLRAQHEKGEFSVVQA